MLSKNFGVNITIISSNVAFIKLVFADCIESMANTLRELGYSVYITENALVDEYVNIVWGIGTHYSKEYDLYRQMTNKYKIIFMNMEQLGSGSALLDEEYYNLLARNRYIDYCSNNIDYLREASGLELKAQEFPLIPVGNGIAHRKQIYRYDFAFFGAMNTRRDKILNEFSKNGYRIKFITGKYADDLSNELLDCAALLNVHYYETSIFEVARCLRPVSMCIPILSEVSYMPESVNWMNAGIVFSAYAELCNKVPDFLNESNLRKLSEKSAFFCKASMNKNLDTSIIDSWA